jgi:hypothetical protein
VIVCARFVLAMIVPTMRVTFVPMALVRPRCGQGI